jgi:hypothetical protein
MLTSAAVNSEVLAILRRACADCHSDETRYPWYAYVAPVSWLLKVHVQEGRAHLNLSRWEQYSPLRRQRLLSEIANQIQEGEMPMRQYTFIHHQARLSAADVNLIIRWTQAERNRLIAEAIAPK